MRKCAILMLVTAGLFGYWQQDVAYKMTVHLDESARELTAASQLTYVNHSPDTLNYILMHLYPNAFNNGTIADLVARSNGQAGFAKIKPWTGITVQDAFLLDNSGQPGSNLNYHIYDDTILRLELVSGLVPGDTLRYWLDWRYKIPEHYDRSGWEGEQFDMAQWYPKFVVYDERGWHDDPFGDWGEYYGEFGTYDVNFDLPEDYIIGATGVVTDGDPGWVGVWVDTTRAWDDWNAENAEFYADYRKNLPDNARKSVTFHAERVHDFAWLTSPDLVYEHGSWDGIDIHVLYDRKFGARWTKKQVEYGRRGLKWLSTQFGRYQYPQFTITKALLGGGMEYPMLIMDGYDREGLVIHEMGHNWFYGMLGNNELEEAWLDEGFTSFQTRWYLETRYPKREDRMWARRRNDFERNHLPWVSRTEEDRKYVLEYMLSSRNEPIGTFSQYFINDGSYRKNVYTKASLVLLSLKEYLGDERFLKGMRLYFRRWHLKHPNTHRFIKAMEDGAGENLEWFFDQWLRTAGVVDYALDGYKTEAVPGQGYETTVHVKRLGEYFMPVQVAVIGPHSQRASEPLRAFRYRTGGTVTIHSEFKPVNVIIDPDDIFMDVNRLNNMAHHSLAARYRIYDWGNYRPDAYTIEYAPVLGYTDAAGVKLGADFHGTYRGLAKEFNARIWLSSSDQPVDLRLSIPWKMHFPGSVMTGNFSTSWLESVLQSELIFSHRWAHTMWHTPIRTFTWGTAFTDVTRRNALLPMVASYTRLTTSYQIQFERVTITATTRYSPGNLGSWGNDFSQNEASLQWLRPVRKFKLKLKLSGNANFGNIPTELLPGVASANGLALFNSDAGRSMGLTNNLRHIADHYLIPGGGNFRGWSTRELYVPYLVALNTQIERSMSGFGLPVQPTLALFGDYGQYARVPEHWHRIADAGLSLYLRHRWQRTNWLTASLAPFSFRIDWPCMRYDARDKKVQWDLRQWSFSFAHAI